jgi:hypothetical protein
VGRYKIASNGSDFLFLHYIPAHSCVFQNCGDQRYACVSACFVFCLFYQKSNPQRIMCLVPFLSKKHSFRNVMDASP